MREGVASLLFRITTGILVATVLLAAQATSARATLPPDPPQNIPMGELPQSCREATSLSCENAVIYYLNQARQQMGLPPYALPSNFPSQSPDKQMFILSNLDRLAYGEPPVAGLTSALSADASQGVIEERDPLPSAGNGSEAWTLVASNWAGGYDNVLLAYYLWVYADGYGSANVDCVGPADPGCWVHRHVVLVDGSGYSGPFSVMLAMGAASGTGKAAGRPSYAMLIAGASASSPPPFYYTWDQATSEGAGSNSYDPGVPDLSTPNSEKRRNELKQLLHPRLKLRVNHAAAQLISSRVLEGRYAQIIIRRSRHVCRAKVGPGSCRWIPLGHPDRSRRKLPLAGRIHFQPPRRWERVTIEARSKPFSLGTQPVAGASDFALAVGPRPHSRNASPVSHAR